MATAWGIDGFEKALRQCRHRSGSAFAARQREAPGHTGLLQNGEISVGAIAEKISLSQSALSQHLAKLRKFNVVDTRRDRQMIYYFCTSDAVATLLGTLDDIFSEAGTR